MFINGYRCMWIVVMFDLPVDTKAARRQYALFRKHLLENGFNQMQYSVYTRHCPSVENAETHMKRIGAYVPPEGEVRILTLTDKQFERMVIFWGKMRKAACPPPRQLELF